MTTDAGGWAALASWAGRHGPALYVGILLGLLAATALAARWWARNPAAPAGGGRGAISLAVIALATGLFAITAWHLGAGGQLSAADGIFLQALSPSVSPAVRQLFGALTHAADTATLTALCILGAITLAARRQPLLAAGWVLAISGNGLLNISLKQAFGRLRPPQLEGVLAQAGLSFPSGHSSGAVVACGMAAYLALRLLPARWHLPALLLAVALAFSIGASRVVLQVHFASDVLAGFASGTAWLALCITGLTVVGGSGPDNKSRRSLCTSKPSPTTTDPRQHAPSE